MIYRSIFIKYKILCDILGVGNMKIILSRKGFDSGYGGMPSPILPDGTMLSMPIPSNGDLVKYCNLYHQGLSYRDIICQLKQKNNAIYIANNSLTLNNRLPGAGCFNYTDVLKLTKEGYSRSVWALPDFFKKITISYNKKAWKDDGFHSAAKGQEFVFESNEDVLVWWQQIFSNTHP